MKKITLIISAAALMLLQLSGCNLKDLEDKIKGQFVDYAPSLAEETSEPNDPPRVLAANPAGCPDWQKNETVDITESLTLPAGCKYDRVNFTITNKSDLTFDCNGAELNGLDREFRQAVGVPYSIANAPLDFGIKIQSSESVQSRNVTIKNCTLRNYTRGIRVSLGTSAQSRSDLVNDINVEALEENLRTLSPKNIRVENSTIEYSHKDGVFVGRFITDFVLENSIIDATGAVGLYLDSGSQRNTIRNSTFTRNGNSDYNFANRVRKKKLANDSREAIAIDSSAQNTIENNSFSGNSRGSILIYKNCNEHAQDPGQTPRYQSADNNLITNNQFTDERIGVWIASRQSKNLADLECGSPVVAEGTVRFGPREEDALYYEDFAKFNRVESNRFSNVNRGVIVEDDHSSILGNEFSGRAEFDVLVGTKYRSQNLSRPVTGTIIENNQFNTNTSQHIELIYDSVDTTIQGNTPAQ